MLGYIVYDLTRSYVRSQTRTISRGINGSTGRAPAADVRLSDRAETIGTACTIVGVTFILTASLWGLHVAAVCCSLAGLVAVGMVWEYLPRSAEARARIEAKEAVRRERYARKHR